jgi:hypothetical protein
MNDRNPDLLPVLSIMRNAFAIPWRKRAVMFRALLPTSVILIALDRLANSFKGEPQNLVSLAVLCVSSILWFVVTPLFAVTCHRLILLGEGSVPKHGLMTWSRREGRFIGWLLLATAFTGAVVVVMMLPITLFLVKFYLPESLLKLICPICVLLPLVLCGYMMARCSILLPATAVDERRKLAWAWETTQGNGWRLFLVIFFLPAALNLPFCLLKWQWPFLNFVASAGSCIFHMVGVTALSLSYQYLVSRGTQPVPKPHTLGSALISENDVTAGDQGPIS